MKVIIMEFKCKQSICKQSKAGTGFNGIQAHKNKDTVIVLYPVELSSPRELDQLQELFYILFILTRKQVLIFRGTMKTNIAFP